MQGRYPNIKKCVEFLFKIAKKDDILPETMKQLNFELDVNAAELKGILDNKLTVFMEIYAPYLEEFADTECDDVRKSITTEIFSVDITQGNAIVKKAADEYRKNQIKTQMYKLWSEKAEGTKNPKVWSDRYRVPILCCVSSKEYIEAKKAFSVLNSNVHSDSDIKSTIEFLENATFFSEISNPSYRDECFVKSILGEYANVLQNINAVKDAIDSLGYEVYDWIENPAVKLKIRSMAEAEYNAGGSDLVISTIDKMSDSELKSWLKDVVKKDIELGLRIITNGGR